MEKKQRDILRSAPLPDFTAGYSWRRVLVMGLERKRGIHREQELVLPAVKWPERHIDTVSPIVTNIRSNVHFLHWFPANTHSFGGFPVHAQRDCVIIRRCTDKGNVAGITDAFIIRSG